MEQAVPLLEVNQAVPGAIQLQGANLNLRPLYDAASSGNWGEAERFLNENPTADITLPKLNGMTILHVAATMGHAGFITSLFRSGRPFPREAMIRLDEFKWSALHYAASYGHFGVVQALVKKDRTLTQVLDGDGNNTPLRQAANNGANKRVLSYLLMKTPINDPSLSGVKGAQLINALAAAGYYDLCLNLLNPDNQLANPDPELANHLLTPELDLITTLVRSPDLFPSGSRRIFWKRWIHPSRIEELLEVTCRTMSTWDINDIVKYFESPVLHYSTKNGVTEVISAFIKHAPDFMDKHSPNVNIILWSIENRREHVFNFMMERDVFVKLLPEYTEEEDASSSATSSASSSATSSASSSATSSVSSSLHNRETYLHAAAKLAPLARLTSVSSPAMQMQRELQWFQGVEKVVRPIMKTYVNNNGQTPRELFAATHEDLAEKAEKWLKDTANSCMVVAALIITVVFTAAFTVPGGDIDGTGIALFLNRKDFMVFIVSDAVGMFSSATSILMFLSILTARYAVDDFLSELPRRLIMGLVSLLIALASMLVAFGVALYIILIPKYTWIVIFPIIGITSIPVFLFIFLQLPLIIDMVRSTYGPSLLKPMKTPW